MLACSRGITTRITSYYCHNNTVWYQAFNTNWVLANLSGSPLQVIHMAIPWNCTSPVTQQCKRVRVTLRPFVQITYQASLCSHLRAWSALQHHRCGFKAIAAIRSDQSTKIDLKLGSTWTDFWGIRLLWSGIVIEHHLCITLSLIHVTCYSKICWNLLLHFTLPSVIWTVQFCTIEVKLIAQFW